MPGGDQRQKRGAVMNIYREFCKETFDPSGVLTDFSLCYKENFNFG